MYGFVIFLYKLLLIWDNWVDRKRRYNLFVWLEGEFEKPFVYESFTIMNARFSFLLGDLYMKVQWFLTSPTVSQGASVRLMFWMATYPTAYLKDVLGFIWETVPLEMTVPRIASILFLSFQSHSHALLISLPLSLYFSCSLFLFLYLSSGKSAYNRAIMNMLKWEK